MATMKTSKHESIAERILTKLIIANDPDYTRLTPEEEIALNKAMSEPRTITHEQLKKELGL